ncbi:unnamed protein product, partial [Gongylonema pulchrum]|uniref:Secreted protein n=1 Tax=Gongylonema pulchrum TaxID=637853 RepID=A0A183EIE0_9BILA
MIFHLKLLHALTLPLHSFLTKGIKATVFSDGEIRLPRFSFYKITVVLLTLSAIWQCISWSNPLGALQWNLSVRPQVNLKPQMSLVAKSHSAPNMLPPSSCSQNSKAKRSKSDGRQFEMAGKVDVGIDARVKN